MLIASLFAEAPLYAILDTAVRPELPADAVLEALLRAGVRVIQYRHKEPLRRSHFERCAALARRTHQAGGAFLINDRADVADLCGADGVHLGQRDLPIDEARRLWPAPGKRFGLSTHNEQEALIASRLSPDYIGVGPVFATPTKAVPDPVLGPGRMGTIIRSVPVPAVALGGIDGGNLAEVLRRGARNFCVVRAVNRRPDPETAIRELQRIWRQATEASPVSRPVR